MTTFLNGWTIFFLINVTSSAGLSSFGFIKWLVHFQIENSVIIYSPSKPVWASFFCWTQKKICWKMLVSEKLMGINDFYSIFLFLLWKSVVHINCPSFVSNRRKNLIQVWNKWRVSKWWQNFHSGRETSPTKKNPFIIYSCHSKPICCFPQ